MPLLRYWSAATAPSRVRSSFIASWPRATFSWILLASPCSFCCLSWKPLYCSTDCSASSLSLSTCSLTEARVGVGSAWAVPAASTAPPAIAVVRTAMRARLGGLNLRRFPIAVGSFEGLRSASGTSGAARGTSSDGGGDVFGQRRGTAKDGRGRTGMPSPPAFFEVT